MSLQLVSTGLIDILNQIDQFENFIVFVDSSSLLFQVRFINQNGLILINLLIMCGHSSFSQIDKIGNNDNIDIRGFTTQKKSSDKMSPQWE